MTWPTPPTGTGPEPTPPVMTTGGDRTLAGVTLSQVNASDVDDGYAGAAPDSPAGPQLRPQSLLLAFFGDHVLEEGPLCVYSGSIIDALGRVGVGEQAVRSTLTRMVNRGLLQRRRQGRRMYFGLTPHATQILDNGRKRVWHTSAVNDDWDGTWTLLGFSLPEAWQRQRHDLRSRLTWAGFGPLYSGLWIAPGDVDISEIVAELGIAAHVKIFHAHADAATDIDVMIRDTWDLETIAARYAAFEKRWITHLGDRSGDPLATRLRLVAEWLGTIRTDPRLPARHLPPNWPARPAEETFRRLAVQTGEPARRVAADLLETTPLEPA
ncbi:PaaX family transcriptional regulator OS=Streptomyces aurantiogriseus OX=66870 GN=paaX PE=4 SV=1 [Streptomyces aurantiogriseus]|uniref:PaaX family transcriptional regulator n=1 Tax=Streptomyces aurantiogriseus TaxID=66870 RepID=A0A918CEM3_9ACTN|nr:PaaX family transcriptional regulator [Streptomyces aurantiogriseus]